MVDFGYPCTPHLTGSTATPDDVIHHPADMAELLRRCTVVQEKVDGLNLGVRLGAADQVAAVLKDTGPTPAQARSLEALLTTIRERVAHTGGSDRPPVQVYGELIGLSRPGVAGWHVFDVFDEQAQRFWSHDRVQRLAGALELQVVPVLHRGPVAEIGVLTRLISSATPVLEGVVLRIESGPWLKERYKFVRTGYRKQTWRLR